MGNEYNSILKEKKVYVEPVVESKHPMFKRFMLLGIFLSLVIIGISYIVYYKTVLSSETVLLNNSLSMLDRYSVIYEGLNLNYDFSNNYMLEGNVKFDSINYKYSFIRDGNKRKRSLSNNNRDISYYFDGNNNYMKIYGLGDSYIENNNTLFSISDYNNFYGEFNKGFYSYFYNLLLNSSVYNFENNLYNIDNYNNVIDSLKDNFNNYVDSDKYIKKFYFYNGRPVVEVNLVLDTNDINKILGDGENNLEIDDDYSVSITSRNDAIMNDIKGIKIIFNNKTDKTREVVEYIDGNFIYTDNNGNKTKVVLSKKNKNFTLKFYKNDILYSVLSGERDSNKYKYHYQVIDKIENISLVVSNNNNKYSYLLTSNLDNNTNTLLVDGVYFNDGAILENVSNSVKYKLLNDNQRNVINRSIKDILFG